MKKYNLSQIMKSAHRNFKNANGEKTFSDCLKSAWKLAKMQNLFSKDSIKERDTQFTQRAKEESSKVAKSTPSKAYNDLSIPTSAYYNPSSLGRMNSKYVGD